MRVLFTGFTSRTIGSERNVYDYMSNVFVLEKALQLAGHVVDTRPVSLLTDPCIEEDYDCAIVGIAACQGLSSRFKLGAMWALSRFGKRAGIFPSDGRNIAVFPSSVRTCLTGEHRDKNLGNQLIEPVDYFLGQLQGDRNNIADVAEGRKMRGVWQDILSRLPHSETNPKCDWRMLVPTFSWGNGMVYGRHFGTTVTTWDPTNIAMPMQFGPNELGPTGKLPRPMDMFIREGIEVRERAWVLSSLQDQGPWLKKQNCKWPIIIVGNKRAARAGEAFDYVPERELIERFYQRYWGHLAFGYPLADGGWWRMRYIHAALAGIVTCCDENDARKMPLSYQHSRIMIERYEERALQDLAATQHKELMAAATSADEAIARVDGFVKGLV